MSEVELKAIEALNGIYVGLLSADEIEIFDRACSEGLAHRSYQGVGGFMGMAKVSVPRTMPLSDRMNCHTMVRITNETKNGIRNRASSARTDHTDGNVRAP